MHYQLQRGDVNKPPRISIGNSNANCLYMPIFLTACQKCDVDLVLNDLDSGGNFDNLKTVKSHFVHIFTMRVDKKCKLI